MKESDYQAKLVKKLMKMFPDSIVMKNDSGYLQGIPDLTVLNGNQWAFLECKRSADEAHQANQDDYIQAANDGGAFGRFIYPENEQEVLHELQQAFRSGGEARVSERE